MILLENADVWRIITKAVVGGMTLQSADSETAEKLIKDLFLEVLDEQN